MKKGPLSRILYFKIISISLITLLSVFILLSLWFQRKLDKSQEQRYLSYVAADELRQSSDDLTRMVRTYVVTKDPKYEKMYWDILAIRNGEKARPVRYENIYWDFMASTDEKPRADGQKVPLHEIMKDLGFTQEEFAKLAEAEKQSNNLVRKEMIAMHAMKGEFQDEKGEFTRKGEPDYEYARSLMHDESYHSDKVDIMTPIDEFFVLINARTEAQVNRYTLYTYTCISLAYVMIILLLLLFGVEIRERKRTEEALRKSEETLVRAQKVGMIGSWHLDLIKNELLWSDESYRIFGIPKGTPMTYEIFINAVHPEDKAFVDKKWAAAINKEPYDIEHRLLINDNVKWVREKAELNYDKEGNPVSGIGIVHDITERKKIDDEIKKLNKELEGKVTQRTAEVQVINKELEEKNKELDKTMKVFVGREMKIRELENRIKVFEEEQ